LTKEGRAEVLKQAKKLKKEKIDLIFASDLLRAKETAEIISKETGAPIIFDKRLREINVGIFNGKNPKLAWDYILKKKNPFLVKVPKGESLNDVRKRVYNFIEKIDQKYQEKNIVIVSHELPLTVLEKTLRGLSLKEIIEWRRENRTQLIKTGQWRKIEFKKLPFNENMEIDFHRPYIDEVKFYCQKCGGVMGRVPEVIDCWFDSGAMPFAQGHWPFAYAQNQKSKIKNQKLGSPELFPADYICEGIDQTRGWFYTLLAVSTLLGFGTSYKNVISLGHILDEKGEKMSKSKGNVVDPWQMIEKYGADTIRWYFFTINQPGDSKLFSKKDIEEVLRKFILTFWNCYLFHKTYKERSKVKGQKSKVNHRPFPMGGVAQPLNKGCGKSQNLLDKWIISRLNNLIEDVSQRLDKYDVTAAARAIENFVIEDLSLWYIRRSRRRFHAVIEQSSLRGKKTGKDFEEASQTLGFLLLTLSKLSAPFIPFLSEEIYRRIFNFQFSIFNSVHLEDWPEANKKLIDKKLEEKMEKVRGIVSLALAERAKPGIRVRQPLLRLKIKDLRFKINEELINLIKEEVNVKEIVFDPKIKKEIELDTKITPELKEEGIIREVIRNIQEMRKMAGLKPKDKISVNYWAEEKLNKILEKNKEKILAEARIKDFVLKEKEGIFQKEILIDQQKLRLAIKKCSSITEPRE
jgi:isoleucyl-tRNA synthetase